MQTDARIPYARPTKKGTLACARCATTLARPVMVIDGLRVFVSRTQVELSAEFTLGPNGWRYSRRARRRQAEGRGGTLRQAERWVADLRRRAEELAVLRARIAEHEQNGRADEARALRELIERAENDELALVSRYRANNWRVVTVPVSVYCQCNGWITITAEDASALVERVREMAREHGAT